MRCSSSIRYGVFCLLVAPWLCFAFSDGGFLDRGLLLDLLGVAAHEVAKCQPASDILVRCGEDVHQNRVSRPSRWNPGCQCRLRGGGPDAFVGELFVQESHRRLGLAHWLCMRPGLRADFIVVEVDDSGFPHVRASVVNGRRVFEYQRHVRRPALAAV